MTPEEALKRIEDGYIGMLKSLSIEKRYILVNELLRNNPLDVMELRWLFFQLQHKCGINFGVCDYYSVEEGKQYCSLGVKVECTCSIPQVYCTVRNKHKGS